jgi:hypothetical protein
LINKITAPDTCPDRISILTEKEGDTDMANEKSLAAIALALLSTAALSACSSKLEDVEEEGILRIYEVEKVARDVYRYFYDKWGTSIMNSISQSEQVHMSWVKELVEEYKLDDPTEGNDYGEFTNSDLQQLYYSLIEEGDSSEEDALATGAMIEEIDIVDIKKYWDQTEREDIDSTYSKLTGGSGNHLRIFVTTLNEKGVTYEPKYLSQEEFNQIIATPKA